MTTINNLSKTLFVMNHSEEVTQDELFAREQQLGEFLKGVHPKKMNKFIPLSMKKEVAAATRELRKAFKGMQKQQLLMNDAANQKSFAARAAKFNKVTTVDGMTAILPIGLLALAHLKIKKPPQALKGIRQFGIQEAVAQLHQEYLKHKVRVEEKKGDEPHQKKELAPQTTVSEAETEESVTAVPAKESAAVQDSVSVQEESVDKQRPAEAREPAQERSPVEERRPVEEEKVEEPTRPRRPKREKPARSKKKKGFWSMFSGFFKSIFSALVRLFTGSKKKNQKT